MPSRLVVDTTVLSRFVAVVLASAVLGSACSTASPGGTPGTAGGVGANFDDGGFGDTTDPDGADLDVTVGGEHIRGSPFNLTIVPGNADRTKWAITIIGHTYYRP